ncbi:MAG: hypothetical protein NTY09_06910 [bacterium]|nr:hypothetical protein [bacterium]
MNRWTVLFAVLTFCIVFSISCSGGNGIPTLPSTGSPQDLTTQTIQSQQPGNTYILGYYDVYFDPESGTFDISENRTTAYTVNVLPFLNMMISPKNGITLGSVVIHDDDPTFLGVDVEFQVYHPFPGIDQYKAYDLMAIIISEGADNMNYDNLRVGRYGVDTYMKNADGYTRWFNPTDFTTQLIFGYAPGGFQNHAGNAHINPYKYYAQGLEPEGDLWDFLTSGSNHEGLFESGGGRMMELEFPLPDDGIGLMFGLAIACCWEEQGQNPPGGYTPYHRDEAIAVSVTQTPDVWYNETDGSGGKLILDIDLFAWEEQPSVIKIESSVLPSEADFDFASYASFSGDNYSTWHVEADAGDLTSAENHYYWVIAESQGYDYKNGLPEIPSPDGPLAAFFKYDCTVLGEPASNIAVISPNGGETLWQGMSYEITWDVSLLPITDVMIEWSTDNFNTDIRTIVASTPNDGSYVWAPIPVEDTTTARIRITNVDGPEYDTSDGDFSIALPIWLDVQSTFIVDSGNVTWGNFGSYVHAYEEISPAIFQATNGTSYVGFYGRETSSDMMVRSANGTSWFGSPNFWGSGGAYFRYDYCKVCPSNTGHGWMVTSLGSGGSAYGWYSDIDRGNGGSGNYCFDGPTYNYGAGKYTEIGTDSAGYIYMFGDVGTNGIQWKKTTAPGFTSGGGPGQVTSAFTLIDNGLVSGCRSWARQGQGFALAYFTTGGNIVLAETTDAPTNMTFDASEIVWSKDSSHSSVDDPALCTDSTGRLFCAWVATKTTGGYDILASMRETVNGSWSTPALVRTSTNTLQDVHISSKPVAMPTGSTEDVAMVCWEESSTERAALSPLDVLAFLPYEQISDNGATIQQPDGMCMSGAYIYDILFAYSYNDAGNWDIGINHADFITP